MIRSSPYAFVLLRNLTEASGAIYDEKPVLACFENCHWIQIWTQWQLSWWLKYNLLEVVGDWSEHPVTIGKTYNFKYQLSPIYYKDSQKLAVPHYKLNLKNMHLFYDRSGYFKVTVDLKGSEPYEYVLNPTLGDTTLVIGEAVISRGNFRFPIFGDGEQTQITIASTSMFPLSIQGAEYEAMVTKHSSHM